MSKAKFEALLSIYNAAVFRAGREATLVISTDDLQQNLTWCLTDIDEFAITVLSGDPDNIKLGSSYELQFGPPRTGIGLFLDKFEDILSAPRNRVVEPTRYFFIDSRFTKADQIVPPDVIRYRQVLSLVSGLKKASAYLDTDSGTLVFVHDGKFEVPVNYQVGDLQKIDQAALDKLLIFVGDDTHSEQKLGILESSVRELLMAVDVKNRFSFLLSHLPDLASKANEGYRLFASSFSYDKIRDQLEAAKVEYTAKIHKAFTDIQTQILTIPVATIIVASQMKDAQSIGYEFWVNVAVLAGCWVFTALMVFVILNQLHTLAVLAEEITRQKEQIKKDYKDIADRFAGVFKFLERRLCHQRIALGVVCLGITVGFVLSHVIYNKMTRPNLWSALAGAAAPPTKGVTAPQASPPVNYSPITPTPPNVTPLNMQVREKKN